MVTSGKLVRGNYKNQIVERERKNALEKGKIKTRKYCKLSEHKLSE